MTDLLENVGLMVALLAAGVGATFIVLIFFIKCLDYMENDDV
jgi:uncharacterized membrane protein